MDTTGTLHDCSLLIKDVTKRFGPVHAVRGVSLALPPGEITGLLGPNGAGKTTLIRLCAGWLEPDAGTITILGQSSPATNRRARARMGVVSRDATINPALRVQEVLALQATLYGLLGSARRAACARALDEFQLSSVAHRVVAALSTGMYQRLAIASALLHAPALVLMDEPSTGLDPDVRLHVWDCLDTMRARGTTVLLTTHYLEEAAHLCPTVHIMARGVIVTQVTTGRAANAAATLQKAYLAAVRDQPEPLV